MTFLTREVGMICWMAMPSLRPSTDSMVARTLLISTPRLLSTLVASPSPSSSRPRSRCSVPMYEWCERSASSWASVRTFFARSVNRSKGYTQGPPLYVQSDIGVADLLLVRPELTQAGPGGRPRFAYECLADGGDSRNLVLHDLEKLRLRLGRRDLLQLAQRAFEVAALALFHGFF